MDGKLRSQGSPLTTGLILGFSGLFLVSANVYDAPSSVTSEVKSQSKHPCHTLKLKIFPE
jgi:hypothetical protein